MAASASPALSTGGDEKPAVSAMAFIADSAAQARVSSELFNMTLGKANVREGSIDTALALSEWPRELDLLVVDIGDSSDPVADAAALKTAVPGTSIVIGVGRINDVALYRDLLAVGFADYLTTPLAEGALGRSVERALEHRDRGGLTGGASSVPKDAKPRTLSVIGDRWTLLLAFVHEVLAGLVKDPCPTAIGWAGTMDTLPAHTRRARCSQPTANRFYALR